MPHAPDDLDLDHSHDLDRRLDRRHHQEPRRGTTPRAAPVAERITVGRAPRLITLTLNLDELPEAITESIRLVLVPHQVGLAQLDIDGQIEGRLTNEKFGAILRELGRNVAQVVVSVGEVVDCAEEADILPEQRTTGGVG